MPEAERAAPWLLISYLWPVIRKSRGTSLRLVRVSLTTPTGCDVHRDVEPFRKALESRPGTGAILVTDISETGREHFYGLALVDDAAKWLRVWCRVTGADRQGSETRMVGGWRGRVLGKSDKLLGNLGHMLSYAFKPWPEPYGQRRLDADVFAWGELEPVWNSVLRSLRITAPPRGVRIRTCEYCGGPMPRAMRPQARWCSSKCKAAGHRARMRERP